MEESETKKLTCKGCVSNKWCRRRNVTKGSVTCDENRGLRERKPKKKEPSKTAQSMALLGHMMRKGDK